MARLNPTLKPKLKPKRKPKTPKLAKNAHVQALPNMPLKPLADIGRFILTPHPLTLEGQLNMPAQLQLGENLQSFLARHINNLDSGAWVVFVGGVPIPQKQWRHVKPKNGQIICARCAVKKQVIALVATIALSYFTFGAGWTLGASLLGINGLAAVGAMGSLALNTAIFIGGSMLINKVLAPKVKERNLKDNKEDVFSIGASRNSARQFEPLALVLGEVRYAPDYASLPYTWYEGNDQYLSTIFHAGINVAQYKRIANGNTELKEYQDVSIYNAGFSAMPEDEIPLHTNPDSISGADLEVPEGSYGREAKLINVYGAWVQRATSSETIEIQVDIVGALYDSDPASGIESNAVNLQIDYKLVDSQTWQTALRPTLTHNKTSQFRKTFSWAVERGKYDVRIRASTALWGDEGDQKTISWAQLKSIQNDESNYAGMARIGIKIKATGQISGALDEIKIDACCEPIDHWNGENWVQASSRENGLSNPASQILYLLRGVRRQNRLVAGIGLPDDMIDFDSIKAFTQHCAQNNFTFDAVIKDTRSAGDLISTIAAAGFGQITNIQGKIGITWAWSNQPIAGVANMATMKSASFAVSYMLASSADGIEYTYQDRQTWEPRTIRVAAPNVTTPINPSRISAEGVTDANQAAQLARWHLAQSIYQYKDISFETDLEHLDYRRLSVLAISHDLTRWGSSGRLVDAQINQAGIVTLTLDEPVEPLKNAQGSGFIGLRLVGESAYRVFKTQRYTQPTRILELVEPWPSDATLPGTIRNGQDLIPSASNPAHDAIWIFDFRATPGYKVRVVNISPASNMTGASVSVVPESDEFWQYVRNGEYEIVGSHDTPNLNLSNTPIASNLKITEQRFATQGTSEMTVTFDAAPNYENAEIWAAPQGIEPVLVASTRGFQATWRADTAGTWIVQVRPFSKTRAGVMASLLYTTTTVDAPPWNYDHFSVQEVDGGMRKYAFAYLKSDPPIDLVGAEIRFAKGLKEHLWDDMDPLGGKDGFFTANFDSIFPPAGQWRFALRARNRAGLLSATTLLFDINLKDNFNQAQVIDPTPPPQVTGLKAQGGFSHVVVNWDAPNYSQGRGHQRTLIYGSTQPNAQYADAEVLAQSFNSPVSFASELGQTWTLWAKHETRDGVLSEQPSNPATAKTSKNPNELLGLLAGEIGKDQLKPDILNEIADSQRISQSVAARVNRIGYQGELHDLAKQWDNTITINQVSEAVAEVDGSLMGKWGVEMALDSEGKRVAGGFSLIGKSKPGEQTNINFGVVANRFSISAPQNQNYPAITPFVVQTSPTMINGVELPAGVYIDAAHIGNLSALNAKIGNLIADKISAASIDAAQINIGSGEIGGSLKSRNFEDGKSGWLLQPDGTLKAAGAQISGTINAWSGSIGGFTIASDHIRSNNYQQGRSGVRISAAGDAELRSANNDRVWHIGATGSDPILRAPGLEILANGTSQFSGQLNIGTSKSGKRREITNTSDVWYDENNIARIEMRVI